MSTRQQRPGQRPRVVLFTDSHGWHERRLRAALAGHGVEATSVSLRDCGIGFGSGRRGLDIPGFRRASPDGVFVRSIPAGSFEQVTVRLDILHALGEMGVPVYNPARVIERTVDKAMTSLLLLREGVPTPPVWVCESHAVALEVVRAELERGHRLVLKPLFGSQGRGLQLVDSPLALPPPESAEGIYYLQRFVAGSDSEGRDWRVMVAGGRVLGAMQRRASSWITNRARGGSCHAAPADGVLGRLALDATRAVGANYAGVDLVRDRRGRLTVLEVNGIPAWKGLEEATGIDIANLLAGDLLGRLGGVRLRAV